MKVQKIFLKLVLSLFFFSFPSFAGEKEARKSLKEMGLTERSFRDVETFAKKGFVILRENHKKHDYVFVAAKHPLLEGYVVKAFLFGEKGLSFHFSEYTRQNFSARITNALKIKEFIEQKKCRFLTVPNKWIYEVPLKNDKAPPCTLLLAEEMTLLSDNKKAYLHLSKRQIEELCLVLTTFGTCDFIVSNMPVTSRGKIAFIDTESLHGGERHLKQKLLFNLHPKMRKYAALLLKEALDQAPPPRPGSQLHSRSSI